MIDPLFACFKFPNFFGQYFLVVFNLESILFFQNRPIGRVIKFQLEILIHKFIFNNRKKS